MDQRRRLIENIRASVPDRGAWVTQGIVESVEGNTCTCRIGSIVVEGVRLRASEAQSDTPVLITPRKGSAVLLADLTGDLTTLAVISVDEVESITLNGGKLGGLVNIEMITEALNRLVDIFNKHTHQVSTTGSASAQSGMAAPVAAKAFTFSRNDYEDTLITH